MRYPFIDSVRGAALISMILYHGAWDLVFFMNPDWPWFTGTAGYLWQQSICWSFIVVSGYCWSLGKQRLKRGIIVFGAGALIWAVTVFFMPEQPIIFGILTFLGTAMLLMIPLRRLLEHIPPGAGLFASLLLFGLFRNINDGYLGFEHLNIAPLPQSLYQGTLSAFLGFPGPDFFSADYFSLFPWFFLFLSGYFLFRSMEGKLDFLRVLKWNFPPFSFAGRHALLFYLIHQPVLYGAVRLFSEA